MTTLEQVLNRTENLNYQKEYKYTQHGCIFGKPDISSSKESLKRYHLKIKLHNSWCNPQSVINDIEKKAKTKQIIQWFQKGNYIGNYVIENFKVNISQQVKGAITFAELEITMLEKPNLITEFQQNSSILPQILLQTVLSESSNIIQKFISNNLPLGLRKII